MVNGQQHATTTQSPTQSPAAAPAAAPAAVFLLLLLLPMGILALIFPPLPTDYPDYLLIQLICFRYIHVVAK